MRTHIDTFHRLMGKARRETRLAIIAVSFRTGPPRAGEVGGGFSTGDATPEEIEQAANVLLDLVLAAGGDPNCPCCVDRLARAKAALAALRPEADDAAQPITSLH